MLSSFSFLLSFFRLSKIGLLNPDEVNSAARKQISRFSRSQSSDCRDQNESLKAKDKVDKKRRNDEKERHPKRHRFPDHESIERNYHLLKKRNGEIRLTNRLGSLYNFQQNKVEKESSNNGHKTKERSSITDDDREKQKRRNEKRASVDVVFRSPNNGHRSPNNGRVVDDDKPKSGCRPSRFDKNFRSDNNYRRKHDSVADVKRPDKKRHDQTRFGIFRCFFLIQYP